MFIYISVLLAILLALFFRGDHLILWVRAGYGDNYSKYDQGVLESKNYVPLDPEDPTISWLPEKYAFIYSKSMAMYIALYVIALTATIGVKLYFKGDPENILITVFVIISGVICIPTLLAIWHRIMLSNRVGIMGDSIVIMDYKGRILSARGENIGRHGRNIFVYDLVLRPSSWGICRYSRDIVESSIAPLARNSFTLHSKVAEIILAKDERRANGYALYGLALYIVIVICVWRIL